MYSHSFEHLRDMFWILTVKELKLRYSGKVFGYFWSIANPLAFALIYFFVFSVVLKIRMENYALFLICGLFPWQWFSNSLMVGTTSFLTNSSLIKKVRFKKNIIIIVVVGQDVIHFILSLPVILLFVFYFGLSAHWNWLWGIPLLIYVQFLITYSIALFLATINLFFRDMENFVRIFLMMGMYLTPIMYSETMIPEKYKHLLIFNPFALMIINWRSLFMEGFVNGYYLLLSSVYALFLYLIGRWSYRKLHWHFAEIL